MELTESSQPKVARTGAGTVRRPLRRFAPLAGDANVRRRPAPRRPSRPTGHAGRFQVHRREVEDGYQSARLTALAVTASLRRALSSVESVTWLRATVYVNAVAGLGGPALTRVADGFSDVINEIFGDRGRHARATMGAPALAFDVPTIVEGMVAVSTASQSPATRGGGADANS